MLADLCSAIFGVLLVLFLNLNCSCTNNARVAKAVVNKYGVYNPDLIRLSEKYTSENNKKRAADYILANLIEQYSLTNTHTGTSGHISYEYVPDYINLNADSIIHTIDYTYSIWEKTPWQHEYTQSQFFEYILPYRVATEPLEYYWKWDIPRWLELSSDAESILTFAQSINNKIRINISPQSWGNLPMKYSATVSGQYGKCDDRAILTTMAMRSLGIPAAFEFVPWWGDNNNGHSFCSVIMPDGSVAVFQSPDNDGDNGFMMHKTAKIYRKTYAAQRNSILYKNKDTESIPSLFSDFRILDVTTLHGIGQRDLNIPIKSRIQSKIAYLTLFSPNGWYPIAYAKNRGHKTQFTAVGDGTDNNGKISVSGENIGDGILYLPALCVNDEMIPAAQPVIVSPQGIRKIAPGEEAETVILNRKYPRLKRVIKFADQMIGGVFEGANKSDFSDACELYSITDSPASHLQRIDIPAIQPFKYIRYRKPSGAFCLGELKAYDDTGSQIGGHPIAPPVIAEEDDLKNIYDGDPLTYFAIDGGLDLWTGIEFNRQARVAQIEFCPRNDDNQVSPGDEYELFYWDNEWRSLGRKTATDFRIEYDNVPVGALLWLRDLTRGREERPFTYENQNQIWW